tara:strand:+ start:1131 stop:2204 length:1074 start_codon:yes stop_codon:yes gene_type:complete
MSIPWSRVSSDVIEHILSFLYFAPDLSSGIVGLSTKTLRFPVWSAQVRLSLNAMTAIPFLRRNCTLLSFENLQMIQAINIADLMKHNCLHYLNMLSITKATSTEHLIACFNVPNGEAFPNLSTLIISNTRFGDLGMRVLANAINRCFLPGIRSFVLNYNTIGDEGMFDLSDCIRNGMLRKLDCLYMVGNQFTRKGVESMCSGIRSGHLSNLTAINLSSNHIDSKGVLAFANVLKFLTSIQTLMLGGNFITGDDVVPIMNGITSSGATLKELSLPLCQITNSGIRDLVDAATAVRMQRLDFLNLCNNRIDASGARVFLEATENGVFPKLISVYLSKNQISASMQETLSRVERIQIRCF